MYSITGIMDQNSLHSSQVLNPCIISSSLSPTPFAFFLPFMQTQTLLSNPRSNSTSFFFNYLILLCFFNLFGLGVISCRAHGLFLTLQSGTIPVSALGTIEGTRNQNRSSMCKASTLSTVPSLCLVPPHSPSLFEKTLVGPER